MFIWVVYRVWMVSIIDAINTYSVGKVAGFIHVKPETIEIDQFGAELCNLGLFKDTINIQESNLEN